MGYSDYDLARPLIAIANSWNRVAPGHYNLNLVSDYVKQGVRQAGGTPVEFGVIAACDGIAQGHDGMHYILPSRKLHLHVGGEVIKKRLARWKRPEPKFKKGYLALYVRLAESAHRGAIIRHKFE
jgi:dihydroxyacid dehydratase/phosphogluconate dehydratase